MRVPEDVFFIIYLLLQIDRVAISFVALVFSTTDVYFLPISSAQVVIKYPGMVLNTMAVCVFLLPCLSCSMAYTYRDGGLRQE